MCVLCKRSLGPLSGWVVCEPLHCAWRCLKKRGLWVDAVIAFSCLKCNPDEEELQSWWHHNLCPIQARTSVKAFSQRKRHLSCQIWHHFQLVCFQNATTVDIQTTELPANFAARSRNGTKALFLATECVSPAPAKEEKSIFMLRGDCREEICFRMEKKTEIVFQIKFFGKNSPGGRDERRETKFLRRHHAERNLSMSMNNEAINSPIRNGRVALSDLSSPLQ